MTFPIALSIFRSERVDRIWAAAAAAVHLTACGRTARWQASFPRPISLRLGGAITVPVTRVECEHDQLRLLDSTGATSEHPASDLEEVAIGGGRLVLLGPETRAFLPLDLTEMDLVASRARIADVRRTLSDAIRAISADANAYVTWIADAVHSIIPALPPEGAYASGSDHGLRGVIHMSFPIDVLRAAESLVHEASHQYLRIAQFETLLTNGEDTRVYWSPYLSRERPIDRILLAYHAFGNVVLLYRALSAAGSEQARSEIGFHVQSIRGFCEALEESHGLTADGRALFEALRDALE